MPLKLTASTKLAELKSQAITLREVEAQHPPIASLARRLLNILEWDGRAITLQMAIEATDWGRKSQEVETLLQQKKAELERVQAICSSLIADRQHCKRRIVEYLEVVSAETAIRTAEPRPKPISTSSWQVAISEALRLNGLDSSYGIVAAWLESNCPDIPLPGYCTHGKSLTYGLNKSKQARDQFQKDLSKVRRKLKTERCNNFQ